jgi:hypothetical protein
MATAFLFSIILSLSSECSMWTIQNRTVFPTDLLP